MVVVAALRAGWSLLLVPFLVAVPSQATLSGFPDHWAADLAFEAHDEGFYAWIHYEQDVPYWAEPVPLATLIGRVPPSWAAVPVLAVRTNGVVVQVEDLATGEKTSLGDDVFDTVVTISVADAASGVVTVSRDQLVSVDVQLPPQTSIVRVEGGREGAAIGFKEVRLAPTDAHHAVHQLTTPLSARGWEGVTAGAGELRAFPGSRIGDSSMGALYTRGDASPGGLAYAAHGVADLAGRFGAEVAVRAVFMEPSEASGGQALLAGLGGDDSDPTVHWAVRYVRVGATTWTVALDVPGTAPGSFCQFFPFTIPASDSATHRIGVEAMEGQGVLRVRVDGVERITWCGSLPDSERVAHGDVDTGAGLGGGDVRFERFWVGNSLAFQDVV